MKGEVSIVDGESGADRQDLGESASGYLWTERNIEKAGREAHWQLSGLQEHYSRQQKTNPQQDLQE